MGYPVYFRIKIWLVDVVVMMIWLGCAGENEGQVKPKVPKSMFGYPLSGVVFWGSLGLGCWLLSGQMAGRQNSRLFGWIMDWDLDLASQNGGWLDDL